MESNLYQTDSVEIKRSEINFAGYNPMKITDKARKLLKKNIQSEGLMGGIVWNKTTGNLVGGHSRISIIDELQGYPEKDYLIRVEVVEMNEKKEKEQNVFLNNKNSQGQYDASLLANMIGEIDYKLAGLDESDLKIMNLDTPNINLGEAAGIQTDFARMDAPNEAAKAAIKEKIKATKADIKANVENKFDGDPYLILNFENFDNKAAFMERFGLDINEKYVGGEGFSDMIERAEDHE